MTDPYHVCFAVPDLEQAMADFTTAAGIQWNPVRNGTLGEWEYRIVFSTGAPRIELIEGPAGSPWDATGGPRFDHLGWWAHSQPETSDRLEQAGLPVDFDGGEHGRRFAYHHVQSIGARFEIVDDTYQDEFARTWPPHELRTKAISNPNADAP